MALITEDGTARADAESYISVSEASSYHSLRGNTTWAIMTSTEIENALRRATDYMEQVYRTKWAGYRKTETQALSWPRTMVPNEEFSGFAYYSDSIVPVQVKNACAELAWRAAAGELAPDVDRATTREKVGPLEVEYSEFGSQLVKYRAVDNLLATLLVSVGGTFRQVVRA